MFRFLSLLFIILLFAISMEAQVGSFGVTDARSLGMGNTYTATTYDLYAIGKNPGLLSKRDDECKITLIFPNLTAQQYGIDNTLKTFDYYASNRIGDKGIISIDKEKFKLALDNGGKLFVDGLLGFFSAAYHPSEQIGSFAFSMSDYLTGYLNIPVVVLDVNYGAEIPEGNFTFDDFEFKAWWIRSYALSYSRYLYKDQSIYRGRRGLIESISAGITAKYALTYAYSDIKLSADAHYSDSTRTLSGSYQAHVIHSYSEDLGIWNTFDKDNNPPPGFMRLKPSGKGFGFDLGGAAKLKNGWTIGLAITDMGMIKWKGRSKKSDFNGYIDISGAIDNETIDSIATGINLVKEETDEFTTPMPTALRLGVALQFDEMFKRFPGKLLMGIDYNQGLNNQPSNYTEPRFSIGFEYHYKRTWPILIGGYTADLLGINRAAIGFGYKTWLVDVYISTIDIFDVLSGGERSSLSAVARWKISCGRAKNNVPECY